jgi:hypothetical protein
MIKVEIGLESLFEMTEVFHSIILFVFASRIVSDSAAHQHQNIPHTMFIL